MARKRVVGAWVIVMRVFPAAILRDAGGGGTNANSRTKRSMRAAIKLFEEGEYVAAYLRPVRGRAILRSRRAGAGVAVDQVLARAVKYAQEGRVSRAVQALEAAQLAPATTAMLQELIALHPAAFTPRDCVRREEVKRKIAAVRKRKEWKKLDFKIFRKATMSMPRAATTWATTGLIRAVARTRLGLHKLHWMAEQLINAQPPKETWPLFFDGNMMGLDKLCSRPSRPWTSTIT